MATDRFESQETQDDIAELDGMRLVATTRTYSVTTTANTYVAPWKAIGQVTIPQADLDAYGEPVDAVVITAGYPHSMGHISGNAVVVSTYSAGTFDVKVKFLKISKSS